MDTRTFITNYQEAFGKNAELPIVFWYSDRIEAPTEKIGGCFFKSMKQVREGKIISLNAETIACGGGKFYTGFTDMPERVPGFVSLKEKYKKTPEMVLDFVDEIHVPKATKNYLHFARIDQVASFDEAEGLLFLATPDVLSGLATWAYFDNNAPDAVATPFGSGCCSVVTQTVIENRNQGRRTFLGFLDPSVRPHFEPDLLSFTIPMSRFKEMYHTMRESCLFDTHAWGKIKERIQHSLSKEEIPPTQSAEASKKPSSLTFSILPDISLREVVLEDAAAIYHAIDTHRDYMRTWLPFVDNMKSVADEEAFLKSVLSVPAERYEPIFGVWNERNEICGLIGFHFSDYANHRTEIGYWLLPEYQHRGIMTASVRRLCQWAVEKRY
ncbi:MAG: GNAT family N-acetyltransferase [Bacteroides sp.]|nr:GNAT family N-acetyltransferase [Bacteroides sp.]